MVSDVTGMAEGGGLGWWRFFSGGCRVHLCVWGCEKIGQKVIAGRKAIWGRGSDASRSDLSETDGVHIQGYVTESDDTNNSRIVICGCINMLQHVTVEEKHTFKHTRACTRSHTCTLSLSCFIVASHNCHASLTHASLELMLLRLVWAIRHFLLKGKLELVLLNNLAQHSIW